MDDVHAARAPRSGPDGTELQLSQLRYVITSRAAATTLAENYTGYFPLTWDLSVSRRSTSGQRQPRPRWCRGRSARASSADSAAATPVSVSDSGALKLRSAPSRCSAHSRCLSV